MIIILIIISNRNGFEKECGLILSKLVNLLCSKRFFFLFSFFLCLFSLLTFCPFIYLFIFIYFFFFFRSVNVFLDRKKRVWDQKILKRKEKKNKRKKRKRRKITTLIMRFIIIIIIIIVILFNFILILFFFLIV